MQLSDFQLFCADAQLVSSDKLSHRIVREIWERAQIKEIVEDHKMRANEGSGGYPGRGLALLYWEFVECVAALACFTSRSPYVPLERKIEGFIVKVLQGQAADAIKKKRVKYVLMARKMVAPLTT